MIFVESGQVPVNSTVTITLNSPAVGSVSCPGGSWDSARPTSCTYSVASGASSGTQIGRQDFRVPASTPVFTRVGQMAQVCSSTCLVMTVDTQGPGAEIHPPPSPPPPPSFPFAEAICTGENSGGTASAGQLDTCVLSAFVGDSYTPGQSVIVKPNVPSGSSVADCAGVTRGSYQTMGTITGDGYCRLSVVTGSVPQFETLGTETVRLAGNAYPGTPLDQWVDFCNPPDATDHISCLGTVGFIPVFGPGADLAPDPPIFANGVSLTATEGKGFTATVATYTDTDPKGTFGEYSAIIDWGDGSAATIGVTGANAAAGAFDVTASHIYAEEGVYAITVSVSDVDTAFFNTATATSTVTVADAPLTASGHDANTLNPFSATMASFTDANPNGTLADYSASIEWGDGSVSAGSIAANGTAFDVTAGHTYANLGPYTLTTKVCDVGGSCATATSHLLVYGLSDGGNFVIGNGNRAIGSAVMFWGAQWASANTVSGGSAPDAFKGFADHPVIAPGCGTVWTTGPGNSASPPTGIPTYMAVIVANSVTQSGPDINGDTINVVVVKTDSGYGPDPGHPGTAAVIAQLC